MLLFNYISRLQLQIIVINCPMILVKFHLRSACWLKRGRADWIPAKESVPLANAPGGAGGQRGHPGRQKTLPL